MLLVQITWLKKPMQFVQYGLHDLSEDAQNKVDLRVRRDMPRKLCRHQELKCTCLMMHEKPYLHVLGTVQLAPICMVIRLEF